MAFNAGDIEAQLVLRREQFSADLAAAKRDGSDFEVTAHLRFDSAEAKAESDKTRAQLDEMAEKPITATLRLDDDAALAEMAKARAEMDALSDRPIDIAIKADTASVDSATSKVSSGAKNAEHSLGLLATAAIGLGPAIVPLGAAGLAIGAGFVAGAGVGVLALAGIKAEIKAGGVAGQEYTGILDGLKGSLTTLETTAAGGFLTSVQRGADVLKSDLPTLNSEVSQFSGHIGDAGVHLESGVLGTLIAIRPIASVILDQFEHMAAAFDHSVSGGGLTGTIDYLQQNLPTIERDVSEVVDGIGHLLAAGATGGVGILSLLGDIGSAISAIPLPILRELVPLISASVLAFKAYSTVGPLITGAVGAIQKIGPGLTTVQAKIEAFSGGAAAEISGFSANVEASTASIISDAEAMGSGWGEATVSMSTATGTSTRAIVAFYDELEAAQLAVEQSMADLDAAAATALGSITALDAALAGEAEAASATAVAAYSAVADAAVTAAGTEDAVSVGLLGALGPIGAVAAGVGVLAAVFLGHNTAADKAKAVINSYTSAVEQDTGAIQANVTAQAAHNLQTSGADTAAQKLGISTRTLLEATLGQAPAQDKVNAALAKASSSLDVATKSNNAYSGSVKENGQQNTSFTNAQQKTADSVDKVRSAIAGQAAGIKGAITAYNQYQTAIGGTTITSAAQLATIERSAAALHETVPAYAAAQTAAKADAAALQATTAKMQQENDAAGLLSQALDKLGGNTLGVAQSQTEMNQANQTAAQTFKNSGAAIEGNSAKALANQYAIEQAAGAAQSYAQAVAKQTGSTDQANSALAASKRALEDQLSALGPLPGSVQAFIDKLYAIPATRKTQIDLQDEASARLDAILTKLGLIHSKVITVTADYVQVGGGGLNGTGGGRQEKAYGGIAYSNGGVLPGYEPGHDSVNITVSKGEGILVPEAVKGIGGAAGVYALNSHYAPRVSGHTASYGGGFANGGVSGVEVPIGIAGGASSGGSGESAATTAARLKLEQEIAKVKLDTDQEAIRLAKAEAAVANAKTAAQKSAAAAALATTRDAITKEKDADAATLKRLQLAVKTQEAADKAHLAQVLAAARASNTQNTGSDLSSFFSGLGVTPPGLTAYQKMIDSLQAGRKLGLGSNTLVGQIAYEGKLLNQEVQNRGVVATKLQAAEDKLKAIQDTYNQAASNASSAVTGTFDIGTAGNGSAAGFSANLDQEVAAAEKFATQIAELRTTALDPKLIDQLAEEGPQTAGRNVDMLSKYSASQIAGVNAGEARLAAAGASVGAVAGGAAVAASGQGSLAQAAADVATQTKAQAKLSTSIAANAALIAKNVAAFNAMVAKSPAKKAAKKKLSEKKAPAKKPAVRNDDDVYAALTAVNKRLDNLPTGIGKVIGQTLAAATTHATTTARKG